MIALAITPAISPKTIHPMIAIIIYSFRLVLTAALDERTAPASGKQIISDLTADKLSPK